MGWRSKGNFKKLDQKSLTLIRNVKKGTILTMMQISGLMSPRRLVERLLGMCPDMFNVAC